MPVKLIPLTCPSCGGQLEIPDEPRDFYCQYCGTRIRLDDGSTKLNINANINKTVTIRDEAALRRLEIEERRERERQEEELELERRRNANSMRDYRKRWLRLLFGYPITFVLLFFGSGVLSVILAVVFGLNTDPFNNFVANLLALYLLLGVPAWIIYIIVKRPRKPR